MSGKKILIAYYSHSGNTKAAAEKIQSITGGELYEIKPVKPYPAEYNAVVEMAKQEKNTDFYPEIEDNCDVQIYDVIFTGTPVWWYTLSGPVKTFLKKNNFEGKLLVPFCTHGGGGASNTYSDMKKLAAAAEVAEGFTSYGNSAGVDDIKKWISSLKI